MKEEEITHIVHLAAVLIPFCQQHPVAGAMVNVIGTLNLFEAARDAGRRFVSCTPVRLQSGDLRKLMAPKRCQKMKC